MSLPTPNLDDRTWESIVDEAKKKIPGLCPDWTDFNPSDPGIALVELMGWMTEMLLYRLNQVPDKNYIKFLELIGITLTPPECAEAWLSFAPSEGAPSDLLPVIPANTKVSGIDPDEKTITFETLEPLNLNNARLTQLFTLFNEIFTDRTSDIAGPQMATRRYDMFKGEQPVPHFFFIGDPALTRVGEEFSIRFSITVDQPGVPLDIHWCCWTGKNWLPLIPSLDETDRFLKSGSIIFNYLPPMKQTEVNGVKAFWLRLQLKDYSGGPLPIISQFTKTLEIKKTSGVMPEAGYFSSAEIPFMPILFQGTIMPFGQDGKENDTFYVGSQVFSRKGVRVTLDIALAGSYKPPATDVTESLTIDWEYFSTDGKWARLGTSSPNGTLDSAWAFVDHTEAFTHSGTVRFYVPADIVPLDVNGIKLNWVRAVIRKGNYGTKKKKNPPICQRFLIKYKEKPTPLEHYIAYDNFQYRKLNSMVEKNQQFSPYLAVDQDWPEMYMGFDMPFTNNLHSLYFRLVRRGRGGSKVVWEYPSPEGWQTINLIRDDTQEFTRRGLVQLIGPPDWIVTQKFGKWAYWIRIRWKKFNLKKPPRLRAIQLNVVKAINAVSHKDELLGSGTGQPFQHFTLKHNESLLPNPRIIVKELESTIPREISDFRKKTKEEILQELDPNTGQVKALWVVWQERDNFYHSEAYSRHYIFDCHNGKVTFGDGIRGSRLPIGQENVKAQIYYTGGGSQGNMGHHRLNAMQDAIPFIDSVTNPFPAAGGADKETLDEARLRAPWELKHRHRAVTIEDFEQLAKEASGEVDYAHCAVDDDGIIEILILPVERPSDKGKLIPSPELCERVKNNIDKHRLITTSVKVFGPNYIDVDVWMEVDILPDAAHRTNQIRKQIEDALRLYVHPLKGDMYRKGYLTGKPVYLTDLYSILENIEGVYGIDGVKVNNYPIKTKIDVPKDSLAYIATIDIEFKGS